MNTKSLLDKEFEKVIAPSLGTLSLNENEIKNCNQIAEKIQKEKTLIYCNGYYEYESGVFLPVDEVKIKKFIKENLKDKFTQFKANEILHSLKVDISVGCPEELNATNLLNLKNGMFNLDTLELISHSTEFKSTIQLPVNYNPDANCFKWFETMRGIFPDDIEKADLLQEFFGLCLTKDMSQEKALFMIGEGANGKSTILHILQQILGKRNYSSVPLEQFNNPHYIANLHNRLANISIETNAKSSVYDSLMKAVISGDTISADLKFKNVIQFNPFCKLIFALNSMPRVDDKTDAFYRRLIIVRFNRQFQEEEQNKNLKQELEAEMDGIFAWMVNGLKRLRQRGHFELSGGIKQEVSEYRKDNNNVMTFIDEECQIDNNFSISKQALYDSYAQWCKVNGYRGLSKNKFGREIIKHFSDKIRNERDVVGDRVWFGIGKTG
jgi:putative DNA primase/helicase